MCVTTTRPTPRTGNGDIPALASEGHGLNAFTMVNSLTDDACGSCAKLLKRTFLLRPLQQTARSPMVISFISSANVNFLTDWRPIATGLFYFKNFSTVLSRFIALRNPWNCAKRSSGSMSSSGGVKFALFRTQNRHFDDVVTLCA